MLLKKASAVLLIIFSLSACAILSEFTALTKCEFRFESAEKPTLSGIDVMSKKSITDFSFMDGQMVLGNILRRTLPFSIVANVEIKNPGVATAAVNEIEWIAFIDDIRVSDGVIASRVEILPGATSLVPIRIQTDLFEYLEGDNPRTMLNFGLNLVDAGGQPTRLSMKIKPSVMVNGQKLTYPDYFTIAQEYSSGN